MPATSSKPVVGIRGSETFYIIRGHHEKLEKGTRLPQLRAYRYGLRAPAKSRDVRDRGRGNTIFQRENTASFARLEALPKPLSNIRLAEL